MLYEDLSKVESKIQNDLFDILLNKQEIDKQDLLDVFIKSNNYIVEYEDEKISNKVDADINQVVKAINLAYKMSKTKFIWEEKIKSSKKNAKQQLDNVSKAISSIATKLEEEIEQEDIYIQEKEKIIELLEVKDILLKGIDITKKENRLYIDVFIKDESKINENKDIDLIKY